MKKIFFIICCSFLLAQLCCAQDSSSAKKDSSKALTSNQVVSPTQDTTPKPPFSASFDTTEFILKEGDVVSKILRLQNNNSHPQTVRVKINYPGGWKLLTDETKFYTLTPGDTVFIPVRIIPLGKIKGNTKYLINAYVINKDEVPLATAYFYSARPKYVNWDITISPFDKVYLMNDSTTARFGVNIANLGNEELELSTHISSYRKDILLMDTTGKIIKNPHHEFKLKPEADTSFHYKTNIIQGVRNFRVVDDLSYTPGILNERKSYSLFFSSSQSRLMGTHGVQKSKKIDFVRLPNEIKVNPSSGFVFPLTMEANAVNLLTGQPILNLLLSGFTTLDNGATVSYFSQFYFSTYYANLNFLRNSSEFVGYYDKKIQAQLGTIGGLAGAYSAGGRGANFLYKFNEHHSAGVFYTRAPYFFSPADRQSVGAVYNYTTNKLRLTSSYSHIIQSSGLKYSSDYLGIRGSYPLPHQQSVGAGGFIVHHTLPTANYWAYQANATYSGTFLNHKLTSTLFGNYLSAYFSPFDRGDKISANHSSGYRLNDLWSFRMNNTYTRNIYDPVLFVKNAKQKYESIYNNISASYKLAPEQFLGGGFFYNILHRNDTIWMHMRGISTNYSQSSYANNTMFSMNMMAGYSRIISDPLGKDYFFFQYFSLYRYHTFTGTLRYNYGNMSVVNNPFQGGVYYQYFGASINYQYQFRNPHWVLNNYLNYSYFNQFKRHSVGYTPEILYFSNSGWRIRVMAGYYFNSSQADRGPIPIQGTSGEISAPAASTSSTFLLQVGVRKDFNIPFPWASKRRYFSHTYLAFIDLNGNGKWDKNELRLDNVVIRTGEWEVLTNEDGKARMLNMLPGRYNFSAFSLMDLKGYFPNIDDSLNVIKDDTIPVPFVKGIRLYGNVFIDREKISPDAQTPIDLSGIRITANGTKSYSTLTGKEGAFELYVPFGKYTVTMDEKILDDKFSLLQNNIEITLDRKTESLFVTFLIVEKRRKVNVKKLSDGSNTTGSIGNNSTNTPANNNSGSNNSTNSKDSTSSKKKGYFIAGKDTLKNIATINDTSASAGGKAFFYSLPVGPGISYRVQIAASSNRIPSSQFAKRFQGVKDVKEYKEGNVYKYTAGDFFAIGEVKNSKAALLGNGYKGAFIVPFYKNNRIQYK